MPLLVAAVVVLSVVSAVPGVVRAATGPAITVQPSRGIVTSTLFVNGSGFLPNSTVSIDFNDSSGNSVTLCAACAVNVFGNFSDHFPTPASTNGTATVTAFQLAAAASASYEVVSHQAISAVVGSPGTGITVTGTGFDSRAYVTYTLGSASPGGTCSTVRTSRAGGFGCTWFVPYVPYGSYPATAEDNGATGATNAVPFLVTPGGFVAPGAGFVGSGAFLSVDGFPAYAPLEVLWDPGLPGAATIATLETNGAGEASATVAVPATPFGPHSVEVYYSPAVHELFDFRVLGSLALSPSAGYSGEPGIVAVGAGLPANVSVSVLWDPTSSVQSTLVNVTTQTNGSFASAPFRLPTTSHGGHLVSAYVGGLPMANTTFLIDASNLSLAPSTGPGLGTFAATLTGFSANSAANLFWDPGLLSQSLLANATTSSRGQLALAGLVVPGGSAAGPHTVRATDATGLVAQATFVVGPWLTVTPTSARVGSNVSVNGWTLPSGHAITVRWGNVSGPVLATVAALAGSSGYAFGNFSVGVLVPHTTIGPHTIVAQVSGTSIVLSTTLNVVAGLLLDPTHGPVGTLVTARASGLAAGSVSTLTIDAVPGGLGVVSSSLGDANFTVPVPQLSAGAHEFAVEDALGDTTPSTTFTVTPQIGAGPLTVYPGETIFLNGTGFAGDSALTVAWDGTGTSTIATTDGNGTALAVRFVVPSNASAGAHALDAWDGSGNLAPSLGVTVRSLPSVALVSPAAGALFNRSSVSLGWSAAPGGVSYTVELSGSASFGSGTVWLSGINGTSWTSGTLPDGTYYWSVEAVAPGGATAGFAAPRSFGIDTVAPTSSIGGLPSVVTGLSLSIPFNASDPAPASGVAGVELLYSTDGGHDWVAYQDGALFSTGPIQFAAPNAGTYEFQTVAVDHAGNRQVLAATGQQTVRFDPLATTPNFAPFVFLGSLATLGAIGLVFVIRRKHRPDPGAPPKPWSEDEPGSGAAPPKGGA